MPLVFAEKASSFLHAVGAFVWGHHIDLDSIHIHCVILSLVLPLLVLFFETSFLFIAFLEVSSKDHIKVQPGILLFPGSSNPLV
jgi:hypothetical protein